MPGQNGPDRPRSKKKITKHFPKIHFIPLGELGLKTSPYAILLNFSSNQLTYIRNFLFGIIQIRFFPRLFCLLINIQKRLNHHDLRIGKCWGHVEVPRISSFFSCSYWPSKGKRISFSIKNVWIMWYKKVALVSKFQK